MILSKKLRCVFIGFSITAFLVFLWNVDYVHLQQRYTEKSVDTVTKIKSPTVTMNTQTIKIQSGETVTIGALSITNVEGGHKILRGDNGQRDGDLSYAALEFTAGNRTEMVRVKDDHETEMTPFVFDNYLIQKKVVEWNGRSVTLEVSSLPEGRAIKIKKGETHIIGNTSIIYTSSGTMTRDEKEKSFITLQIVKALNDWEDVYLEGQSFVVDGDVIRVKTVNVEDDTADLIVIEDAYDTRRNSSL